MILELFIQCDIFGLVFLMNIYQEKGGNSCGSNLPFSKLGLNYWCLW